MTSTNGVEGAAEQSAGGDGDAGPEAPEVHEAVVSPVRRSFGLRRGRNARRAVAVLLALCLSALTVGLGAALGALGPRGGGSRALSDGGSPVSGGRVSVFRLKPGDCFDWPSDAPQPVDSSDSAQVYPLPCSARHFGEVFATVPLPGAAYPGRQQVYQPGDAQCARQLPDYALDPWAYPGSAWVDNLYPDATQWQAGSRLVICAFDIYYGASSSMRQDVTGLTRQQRAYLEAASLFETEVGFQPGVPPDLDPEDYRIWAGMLVRAGTTELGVLDSYPWSAPARPPMAALATELRQTLQHLQAAAQSPDLTTLEREIYAATSTLDDDTSQADVRRALGLPSDRPVQAFAFLSLPTADPRA